MLADRERDLLDRVAHGARLGVGSYKASALRQRMKKRGLIDYSGEPKRWRITDAGRAALAEKEPQR